MYSSRQPIWRRKSIVVSLIISLLITAVCFYYGILYENPVFITVGFALGILLLLSVIEVIYRMFTLKCSMEIPITMAEQNMPVSVVFKMKNNGGIPSGRVDVRMCIRNSLAPKGKTRWFTITGVAPKISRHEFKVVLYGAGSHEVELIKLRIYSTFGLFSLTKKCTDFGYVLVLPEIYSTQIQVTEATRNFMGDADVFDEFRPGHDPGEIYEIRQYREKDKLQSIHWKLSAKTDELMVKETSLPKACAIVLMLDLKKPGKKSAAESVAAFLELAASISYCLMDQKCPHYITWFSRETEDVRRIRVDDEESFYLFLTHYLRDGVAQNEKDMRQEYRNKYKNEWYLHDLCINNELQVYKNNELITKLNIKKIKDECEKMELLL